MWPIIDFYVNIKFGLEQFTNMEIVIEDKMKFRKIADKFPISAVTQHFSTKMFCSYKSESFRISFSLSIVEFLGLPALN